MSLFRDRAGPALGPSYGRAAPLPKLTAQQRAVRTRILESDTERDYEDVPCLCGAAGPDLLLSEVDRHGLPCRNVVCQACGLVRLTPRWREGRYHRFYETEYRSLYNPSTLPKAQYASEVAASTSTRERARWVKATHVRHRGSPRPCVVELGAGGGWNLARLPDDWQRVGYDVDDEYLAIGARLFGVEMRRGLTTEALPAIASADVVLLSHVVEHFPHPVAALRTLAGTLRPEALLLIEVPGIFRIHRTNLDPRSYLQNAHTFTFCAATLRDTCVRAGLDVMELDETAGAVCRRADRGCQERQGRPELAGRIVTYLQRCDAGFRHYRRLRAVPGVGRYLASAWRRTYFAAMGRLTPAT